VTGKELIEKYAAGDRDFALTDLRGANLRGADLGSADLRSADLSNANLSNANLGSADLGSADLRGADLSNANLKGADLRCVNLRSANLRLADLKGADLSGAKRDIFVIDRVLCFGCCGYWWLAYTTTSGLIVLEYGCETHSVEEWQAKNEDLASQHKSDEKDRYTVLIASLLSHIAAAKEIGP